MHGRAGVVREVVAAVAGEAWQGGGGVGRVVERAAGAEAEEQTTEAAAAEVAGRGRW